MSTSQLFLQPDEVDAFLKDTVADHSLTVVGYEGQEIGLCPCITFYVFHDKDGAPAVADAAISVFEEFSQLIDKPWELIFSDKSQDWHKPGSKALNFDLRERARHKFKKVASFFLAATEADSPAETPRWGFHSVIDDDGSMKYSWVKLTFRERWYRQHRVEWHAFVERCIARLQPEQCYSGFEIGGGAFNILGSYEGDVLVRICADHFFGMDIDHPVDMCFHSYRHHGEFLDPTDLGAGLRPPTWCFLLSPLWRQRLGLSEAEVRARLDDPRVSITAIPSPPSLHNPRGEDLLWVRLGDLNLYPVEQGVPELLVQANALIRPIRCNGLKLHTLEPWDDDPNPRFSPRSAWDWVHRFDEDSQWPTAQARQPSPPPPGLTGRCEAGQPCPRSGWWSTPAQTGSRQHFNAGQPMPSLGSDYGATIWQWDPLQD